MSSWIRDLILDEFDNGFIWDNDIESANEFVTKYVRSVGGNDAMAEDILMIIHESDKPLNWWDGNRIIGLIEDYIDR